MKLYNKFLLLLFFLILGSLAHAEDWAPDSLEGKSFKVTIDDPGGDVSIGGQTITLPKNNMIRYAYVENGVSYWGFDDSHMIGKIYFNYRKTGPKTVDLDIWFASSKIFYLRGQISLTNSVTGTGSFYPVYDLGGLPFTKENPLGIKGTITFELLDSKPSLPQEVTTREYSKGNSADWGFSMEHYYLKHKLPTNRNWSFEIVHEASLGELDLRLEMSEGGAGVHLHQDMDSTGYTTISSYDDYAIHQPIHSGIYDGTKKSTFRFHYQANGRKFRVEFDENQIGNWITFLEGDLDSGVKSESWNHYPPDPYFQPPLGILDTSIDFNGFFSFDVEKFINADIASTQSFYILSFHPLSLNFAVGSDTLSSTSEGAEVTNIFSAAGSDLGLGWRSIEWFGFYFPHSSGWFYHMDHGWIYSQAESMDSIWYWHQTYKWCWTNQTVYPWVWFHDEQSWKYYFQETGNWMAPVTSTESDSQTQESNNSIDNSSGSNSTSSFDPSNPPKTWTVASASDLEMIWVEPGTFTMGSPTTESNRRSNETQHQFTLTQGFYLGKYEVTQAQYEAVMTGNTEGLSATPSGFSFKSS